jgi:hypothetical protein
LKALKKMNPEEDEPLIGILKNDFPSLSLTILLSLIDKDAE